MNKSINFHNRYDTMPILFLLSKNCKKISMTSEEFLMDQKEFSLLLLKAVLLYFITWSCTLKNPTKCLWRWDPDRRYNFFFSTPVHLSAVTYMTEISLIVTLNNQFKQVTNIFVFTKGVVSEMTNVSNYPDTKLSITCCIHRQPRNQSQKEYLNFLLLELK